MVSDVMHSDTRLATYCQHLQGQPGDSLAIVSIYRHGHSLFIFLVQLIFNVVSFDYP
jgi:hypothetical protein